MAVAYDVNFEITNQKVRARRKEDMPESRALLTSQGKPLYLAGMISLDVLRWLEPYDWELKVGMSFYVFRFTDPQAAMLFKLTWF